MSVIHNITQWIHKKVALLTASSPFTSSWYNAETLNGSQMFLTYTGAANVTVDIRLSPADAFGRRGIDPDDAYEEFEALASGANGSEGFFDPPEAVDRPFKSYQVVLTTDANITDVLLGICQHGTG